MNVDCTTHVPNCRKGHCNEIHRLITILLKYSLSFTFLFGNFPVTWYCFHHRPVYLLYMLDSLYVLTSNANTLTRKTFELQHTPPPLGKSFTTESCLDNYSLWTLPPLQWIIMGNSWRGQFKYGLHEMCWNSRRSWSHRSSSICHVQCSTWN
jgi:hypothetical protein